MGLETTGPLIHLVTTYYQVTALTVGHCCCSTRVPSHHEFTSRNTPRILILLSCQGRKPDPEEKKDHMGGGKLNLFKWKMLNGIEETGKRVKQNLSPQQKGDWKDLLLMSISFAVYVYISQMLVCAYFAWTTVPKPMW
ncbi:unnamed protein product [Sphenostylis stenocarpa]|uniref:Uncharacterized protein n=1 Tax=Sphenostylis stenocarpa TaxID=92480 RepID=A0AA86S647_9FABA|nr:unnamed protein product [Sphenostylis stenocarpa]